jgi:FkbM family methyltransferase
MMVRPAVPDPPENSNALWAPFSGSYGWDVGANCGQSIATMQWLFGRVISLEPCRESYEYMMAMHPFSRNDILWLALSDHDGELELAFPATEQKETGQLCTIGLAGMEWEPADWDAVEKVTVPCRTADSLAAELGVPDVMKIDTEGHEVFVLQGATGIIAGGTTDFLIEFHSPENHKACAAMLEEQGYRVKVMRHPHYNEGSAMWNQHGWLQAFRPRNT